MITACGDGSIQLWDTDSLSSSYSAYSKPKSCYREHTKEVCSVHWNHSFENPSFLSSSWDGTIKLWNPDYITSLNTYRNHTKLVYAAKFSKRTRNVFASVSADGYLKLWNILQPQPFISILAHSESEVI